MSEPRWITASQAVRIHAEQLAIYGGPAGIRDQNLLESALGRPRNTWSYGETDIAALAAAYAFGIARNHPFVDGNKRAAFLVMVTFLGKNGIDFVAAEDIATAAIVALAAGEIDEDGLTRWIRDSLPVPGTMAKPKRGASPKSRAPAKPRKR
jgi:death on curing protein